MDPAEAAKAADLAFCAMYAEDMRRETATGSQILTPDPDPRLTADYDVQAYLIANDSIFSFNPRMQIGPELVYYGYVARKKGAPSSWLVGIRGTAGIVEWIVDGQFLPQSHPSGGDMEVEHGFWGIYDTMKLIAPGGGPIDDDAAAGIAGLVGEGDVTVVGHSLGSAIATYLCFDLAEHLGDRVSASLYASPRTGNQAWVAAFDAALGDRCTVYNYLLDIVPHLPTRPDYRTVSNATVLLPSTAEAGVKVEARCNHHVLCYAAMLSYATFLARLPDLRKVDADERLCVLGDRSTITTQAEMLEVAIEAIDGAGHSVAGFIRTIIAFGIQPRRAPVQAGRPARATPPVKAGGGTATAGP